LIPFVVLIFAAGILLSHDGGDKSFELGNVGVNGVGTEFAHEHKLSFKSEFVLAGGGSILFLEGGKELSGRFAVFHASFVFEIDGLG